MAKSEDQHRREVYEKTLREIEKQRRELDKRTPIVIIPEGGTKGHD